MGQSRPLFHYFCLFNTVDSKCLPKTEFELQTSAIGSDRSNNWAAATATATATNPNSTANGGGGGGPSQTSANPTVLSKTTGSGKKFKNKESTQQRANSVTSSSSSSSTLSSQQQQANTNGSPAAGHSENDLFGYKDEMINKWVI